MKAVFLAVPAAALLSGCAVGLPAMVPVQELPIATLVKKIQCEFSTALSVEVEDHPWFRDWRGSYTVTLRATENGFLKSGSNSFPLAIPSGIFTIGASANYTRTAFRNATMQFGINVDDAVKAVADPAHIDCAARQYDGDHPFLTGDLGLREWLDRALEASEARDPQLMNRTSHLTSLGHTFQFTIAKSGGISPGFAINSGKLVEDFGIGLSGDRTDDHQLDVAFAKIPEAPGPTKVIVIQEPFPKKKEQELAALKKRRETQQNALKGGAQADLSLPSHHTIADDTRRIRQLEAEKKNRPSRTVRVPTADSNMLNDMALSATLNRLQFDSIFNNAAPGSRF